MNTQETEPLEPRVVVLLNSNVKMSRGKAAAQAVHAALFAYGVEHGAAIVLGASPTKIREQCAVTVSDAGRTEVEPGTLTAGAYLENVPTVEPMSGNPLRWALADKLCDWHYDRSLSWQEVADRVLEFLDAEAPTPPIASSPVGGEQQ